MHRQKFVTSSLVCSTLGKEVPPALGREPFALMQGPTVAKLAMEASRRHYLHEPRRRPQSTFIVVRHLHFPGNRGFGVRNELCSHIDYSLCSLEAACLNGEGVSLKSQWWAFYMLSTLPPAVPARAPLGVGALPAEVWAGRTPAHGRFYAGCSSPQCQRARWIATRRAAQPP